MLALLFTIFVVGSLLTSTLIFFEAIPAEPVALAIAGGIHLVFAWLFFRAYGAYRSVHRLVHEGRGELFDVASAWRISRERFRGLRQYFRLRRVQGLALCGMAHEALEAATALRRDGKVPPALRASALAAEAEANLLLDQPFWAERSLAEAMTLRGGARDEDVRAVGARLAWVRGDAAAAAESLGALTRAGSFPLTAVTRARNLAWLADALASLGRRDEGAAFAARAARLAPRSYWGRAAARPR
ncbi:MAG: hypothetical protein H6746_08880 [Deltaproteobacteria bacterium]|nr:hypothetical protein [Deltaproteobacteria bacterium]